VIRQDLLGRLKKEKLSAENDRQLKQANYDLLKSGLQDPVISKLKYMEIVGDLYQSMSWGGLRIHEMSQQDPLVSIISNFTALAEPSADAK